MKYTHWIALAVVYVMLMPFTPEHMFRLHSAVLAAFVVWFAFNFRKTAKSEKIAVIAAAILGFAVLFVGRYFVSSIKNADMEFGSMAVMLIFIWSCFIIAGVIYGILKIVVSRVAGVFMKESGGRSAMIKISAPLIFALVIFPYIFFCGQAVRFKYAARESFSIPGAVVEEVSIKSADGISICGYFIESGNSSATVLLVHGVGSSADDLADYAAELRDMGVNVFAIDLRAHGKSGGFTTTFGTRERLDVMAAFDYLKYERPERSKTVVAYGFSMGAAAILKAAQSGAQFDAFILDSPLADIRSAITHRLGDILGLYVYYAIYPIALVETVTWIPDASPADADGGFWDKPALIFKAGRDQILSPGDSDVLYEKFRGEKRILTAPNSRHISAANELGGKYFAEIRRILKTAPKNN